MRRKNRSLSNGLFWESAKGNGMTYNHYFQRLLELSVSMFDWQNLPDTVDPRFLEMCLFFNGHCVYFNDEVMGNLALKAVLSGPFDVYRIPVRRRIYSESGYTRELTNKDSVIIWNNYIHTNALPDVLLYSERLYNLDRIIDVNANAQKTPVLLQTTEDKRLSLKNVYKEWDGNQPVIFANKNFDINSLSVLKTDAPYVADKIYDLKTSIWNEALTYLGISNVETKREKMIVSEVARSMGGTIASRYSRLQARREAADQINKMFGTNIKVEFRTDGAEIEDGLELPEADAEEEDIDE